MRRKIIYVDNFLTGHGHTPTTGSGLVQLLRQEGYVVIATSNKENKALRLAAMLFALATNRRNAVALIATYSTSAFNFAYACSVFCHLLRIPYIPCLHGGNLPERIKASPEKAKQVFANSFINVAVSGYLQKSMLDNGWQSTVIANNILLSAYPFKQRRHCAPFILWVRSFHQIYNPTLAIRVLHALLPSYPAASLTMVGPDKDGSLDDCKALARSLGVEKHVTFTGLLQRDAWVKLAANCDIFMNTTDFDNLPVSVVEAMALGLITITTNVGGIPYLVDDGKNGLLVNAGDEHAFTQAIHRVLRDADLCEKLSKGGREKAAHFDWNNIKNEWRGLLHSIP